MNKLEMSCYNHIFSVSILFILTSILPFIFAISIEERSITASDESILSAVAKARHSVEIAVNDTLSAIFSRDNSTKSTHADLIRLARFPVTEAREIARASEVYEHALAIIRQQIEAGHAFNLSEGFSYHEILSPQQLELVAMTSGCSSIRKNINCTDIPLHLKYRTADGTCNNLQQPLWGSSYTAFKRLLKPKYENGFNLPIGWSQDVRQNGFVPPSARLVSSQLMSTREITPDQEFTHMLMQWGQFIDHDLDLAVPGMSSESFGEFVDCQTACINSAPCFPITIPAEDSRIKDHRCMEFVRNSAICGSDASSVLMNTLMPREQINQLTSYIDASHVYGSTEEEVVKLRDMLGNNGRLRAGRISLQGGPLMPFHDPSSPVDCKRDRQESETDCFLAGDVRANEQLGLLSMHTLWFREHNRVAAQLQQINLHWDGDTIYHEARKIIGAKMQHITYVHWLPVIIGQKGMAMLGEYGGYKPQIDATISNVFATAAFRMGHGLIQPIILRLNASYHPIPDGHLRLEEAFFSPWRLVEQGGIDPILRGLFFGPAKLKLSNQILNSNLTENLFRPAHRVALDLAALNIQRGRDHGLPSYNDWRKFCNLSEAVTFEDLKEEIPDEVVRGKLQHLYGHPNNIDAWVGGMLEESVEGAKTGPTFLCLIVDQFRRLRDGDRFWYDNPGVFKAEQLAEIKQSSLGRVICDNSDSIREVTSDVFRLPRNHIDFKQCEQLPIVDLQYWKECAQECFKTDNAFPVDSRTVQQQHIANEINANVLDSTSNEGNGSQAQLFNGITQDEEPSNFKETKGEQTLEIENQDYRSEGYEKQFKRLERTILRLQLTVQQMALKLEGIETVCRKNPTTQRP